MTDVPLPPHWCGGVWTPVEEAVLRSYGDARVAAALNRVRAKLIRLGAKLPIDVKGTIESAMNSGHSHALLLVEEELAGLDAPSPAGSKTPTAGGAT